MQEALYMDDQYCREWDAEVVSAKEKFVVLNKTCFYPNSGGVEHDTGIMARNTEEFKVVYAGKFAGQISHEVDRIGLKVGDKVHCKLDWDRRYKLMRYHTAAHVLSGMFAKEAHVLITGNQLTPEKGRIDFSLENFDREVIDRCIEKSNELIEVDLPVEIRYMPRGEALKDPNMVKLAGAMPPAVKELRIVDIKGFDYQADGGCHVKSLKEIGKMVFLKAENKGKSNRRVYFELK
ncbi:MAG: alanyl-tRNA editing protein AlaXM [Candidatus Woesearchaeota archaeon]